MERQVISLKGEEHQVAAWERAAARVAVSRHAWSHMVLNTVSGFSTHPELAGTFARVRIPGEVEPPTAATIVPVSLKVTKAQKKAWTAAARRAGLRLHPWIMLVLDVASGLSRLPEQLERLLACVQ